MPVRIKGSRLGVTPPLREKTIDGPRKAPTIEPIAVRIPMAVQLTGIGRSKLYELIADGEIETVKIGSITLIPMISLRALIDRGREIPRR